MHHIHYSEYCPFSLRARWDARQAETTLPSQTAINPLHAKVATSQCEFFRENKRVVMKRGFRNMFHEMPGYKEIRIRHQLINHFGRRKYYEMHGGDRLITPEDQEAITTICRLNGWTDPVVYDGEEEDWVW